MRRLLIGLLTLVLGCSKTKPKAVVPPPPLPARMIGPAAPASKATVIIADRFVPWKYDKSNTTAYWWDLQETTNMLTWTTVRTNLPSEDVTVWASNQYRLYRLRGHR